MKTIRPLSGRGTKVEYYFKLANNGFDVRWGDMKFQLALETVDRILNEFFKDKESWYIMGTSMTSPPKGGFGEFLTSLNLDFSPRHGSAIAAILVEEKALEFKGKKPIMLRRIK